MPVVALVVLLSADRGLGQRLRLDRAQGKAGGELVVAISNPPRTWNPLVATDAASLAVMPLLMADLVGIDHQSLQTGLELARSYELSPDRTRLEVELRDGIRFSDGELLDAADVVFTLRALLDPEVGAPQRDLFVADGREVTVRRTGRLGVELGFSRPIAIGERVFDALFVLPEHRLGQAWAEGRLREAWDASVDPEMLAGLGPYRLEQVEPGVRVRLARNPHYWKEDAEGRRLPYFDQVELRIGAGDAAVAQLLSGDVDAIADLESDQVDLIEHRGGVRVLDLGPGLRYDIVFFNQNEPGSEASPVRRARYRWFTDERFRRAISLVVDREAIVELAYRGRAEALATHVSSGDRLWRDPKAPRPERSVANARALLASAGFERRGAELRDPDGRPVRFTLAYSSGKAQRARIAAVLEQDLAELGIELVLAPLELRSLVDRIFRARDYDAVLLTLARGDADPNSDRNVFSSSGSSHLWRLEGEPLFSWQSEIDRLLDEQAVATSKSRRAAAFFEIQRLLQAHQPIVFLTAPHVLAAVDPDVAGLRPGILGNPILWNVEELWRRDPD